MERLALLCIMGSPIWSHVLQVFACSNTISFLSLTCARRPNFRTDILKCQSSTSPKVFCLVFVHFILKFNSFHEVLCVCMHVRVSVSLVVETLWDSVHWNVWAGFPFPQRSRLFTHKAIFTQHEHVAQ